MISTDEFTIQNGAATVSSAQGRAGNLLLTANSVQLDQARLTAETAQTGGQAGANITLNGLQTLSLRNQSQISANARESANGGNLTINADFILARPTEDSDIRANAIAGNGGNIAITTQGLFGTQPADAPIAGVSDITASSERGIQGVVAINNPNPNPTQGLEFAEAPPETIPLAQECAPITELNRERSSFVVVGRGGVSPSPYEALRSDDIWQDWRLTEVETEQVNQPVTETSVIQTPDSQMPINEAQGWIRNTAGQVQLVAIAHTASSAPPALPRLDCSDLADLSTQSGAEQ
jgi:large exoprotein involved in heme utilization and adhesion